MARWTRLERAVPIIPEWVKNDPEAIAQIRSREVWKNNLYTVTVFRNPAEFFTGQIDEVICLSIKANDKSVRHDWREFQKIKNELLGEDAEAVEVYPAESRLVDTANQYFLWCVKGKQVPFGFTERLVSEGGDEIGAKQRPWFREDRPKDVRFITAEECREAVKKKML